MNMLIKRALTLVAMGFLTVQAVLAMDSPSLVLQFGAIGSEKKFTQTSTLADGGYPLYITPRIGICYTF